MLGHIKPHLEYVAHRNAWRGGFSSDRTANLHLALDNSEIDQHLLDGAAGIIRALLEGGPADSIDDYEYAPDAFNRYVGHVLKVNDLNLDHFLCVSEILQFLSNEEGWESRLSKGWTSELRDQIRDQCREIVNRDVWRNKIAVGLRSEDSMIFDEADIAAAKLKIDTRELHFAGVRSAPIMSGSWYRLLQQTDETQIDEIIDFTSRVLPLEKIATGPADHLGLGPGYEAHGALDWLLQDLKRFPAEGGNLSRPVCAAQWLGIGTWPCKRFLPGRATDGPQRHSDCFNKRRGRSRTKICGVALKRQPVQIDRCKLLRCIFGLTSNGQYEETTERATVSPIPIIST